MSKSALVMVGLLALVAAGCTSTSSQLTSRARDWKELDSTTTSLAPPAENPPAPPKPTVASVPAPQSTNPAPVKPHLPSPAPANTWISLQSWSRLNGLPGPSRVANSAFSSYVLRSTNGSLLLRPGSQLSYWNGLELRLGFAPQMINGEPFVHSLDLKKSIQPLLQGPTLYALNPNPTIVIDPGHGGENAGTRSVLGRHFEKDYTLDWARRLQAVLASNGCQAFLTRSADTDLALSNRVAFAEEHKADLFISLHFNSAAPSQSQTGLETYFLTPVGMPSTLVRGFADEVGVTFPNNNFDVQNFQLALEIHRSLLEVAGHRDRGVRHARFPGVLRNQQRPAILVEGGYLSNPHEAALIDEPAYRQRLAEAVAKPLLQSIVHPPAETIVAAANTNPATLAPAAPVVAPEPRLQPQPPKPNVSAMEPQPETPRPELQAPPPESQPLPADVQFPKAETQDSPGDSPKPKHKQLPSPKSRS